MFVAKDDLDLIRSAKNEHHKSSVQVCTRALSRRTVAPSTFDGGFTQHVQTESTPGWGDRAHKGRLETGEHRP
jgi:hypothetical protein